MDTFGTKALALIVRDQQYLDFFTRNAVDPDIFFPDSIDRWVAGIALDLARRYNKITPHMLTDEVVLRAKNAPKSVKKNWQSYADRVADVLEAQYPDLDWVGDRLKDEIAGRTYNAALTECADLLEKGNVRGMEALLDEARRLSTFTEIKTSDIREDLGWFRQFLEDRQNGVNQGISTGIPDLDSKLFWRGLGLKEVTLVVGGPKRGKTQCLLWLSYAALKRGKNVLYVSLEVSKEIIYSRLVACHNRIQIDSVALNPQTIDAFEAWLRKKDNRGRPRRGLFVPVVLPTKSIGARDVDGIVDSEIKAGRKPDLVVVDYTKLLKHSDRMSQWEGIGESTEILRGTAGKYNLAMAAAAQLTRDGTGKNSADYDDIGFDFSQGQTADTTMVLGKRPNEIQHDSQGRELPVDMKLYLLAGRNNAAATITIPTAYGMGRFYAD